MATRIITDAEVEKLLPMGECIEVMARALAALATPASSPPPPTGTTTHSTPGRSSTISRPAVPAPASTTGSSKGCTNVRPVASRTSWSLSNRVARSSWRITSAP